MLKNHTKKPAEIRSELLDLVNADLLGPKDGIEEEVDERSVLDRYITGKLAPGDTILSVNEQDTLASDGSGAKEDGDESDVKLPWALYPSSLGISFTVDENTKSFMVQGQWAEYVRAKSNSTLTERGTPKTIWKRRPVLGKKLEIEVKDGLIGPYAASDDNPEVKINGRIRRSVGGAWFISLFLDNRQIVGQDNNETYWLFQAELGIYGKDQEAPFIRRSMGSNRIAWNEMLAEEDLAQELNYRKHLEFAVGHGVSVQVEKSNDNPARATRIRSSFIPVHELAHSSQATAESNSDLAGLNLDMKELSELDKDELLRTLKVLSTAYRTWILNNQERIKDADMQTHQSAAQAVVKNCTEICDRIQEGIESLNTSDDALEAFRFANQAMYLQRIRTLRAENKRTGQNVILDEIDIPRNRSWRLFQLGFILLNLASLVDVKHKDRSTKVEAFADLLWFPTGGGKTEAYLGLTAFTMAIRRLQGKIEGRSGEDGVAVLMRYTLRLLTLQQFQRSAALICAAETIRREKNKTDNRWGNTPFRVGLWVGKKTTPNKTKDSEESVLTAKGQGAYHSTNGTPHQLTNCPWCGNDLSAARDIEVESDKSARSRTIVYCSDATGVCDFGRKKATGEGIPVVVVDDEIYRLLPVLVIATVDKFAQMPWQGPVQMLFGQVSSFCPRHGFGSPDLSCGQSHPKNNKFPAVKVRKRTALRPPDLIIQDEMHLISGPLGTLVGLYETAVDELCKWKVDGQMLRPKVIASTATIRLAQEQMLKIFARTGRVFPPAGLDVSDNFFAQQHQSTIDEPGRLYIGVNVIGERIKVILIRVYIAFMASAKMLHNKYGDIADPYMTLVGYFNSLRELGGMRRLVEDDITSRLYKMDQRDLAQRSRPNLEELTSRKTATDIPKILAQLEIPHIVNPFNSGEPKEKKISKKNKGPQAIDVLLATNMISVGVDVKRFGLMIVAGQPKTTAEYIQASSRIGRQNPGIVCIVYNWSRPRDLSHFERFEHYHDTFYKHVEASSVTPFSARALDRGLSGVLVGMIRLLNSELNANLSAGQLATDNEILKRAIQALRDRANCINADSVDELERMIPVIIGIWEKAQEGSNTLAYKRGPKGDISHLLVSAGMIQRSDQLACLNSLREVEPPVNLVIQDELAVGDNT